MAPNGNIVVIDLVATDLDASPASICFDWPLLDWIGHGHLCQRLCHSATEVVPGKVCEVFEGLDHSS